MKTPSIIIPYLKLYSAPLILGRILILASSLLLLPTLMLTRQIVAHRLTTIKECDKILVLDQGTIAESGSHEELMIHGGLYRIFRFLQTAIRLASVLLIIKWNLFQRKCVVSRKKVIIGKNVGKTTFNLSKSSLHSAFGFGTLAIFS